MLKNNSTTGLVLSFNVFFAFFSLAESLPHDLQITAYKIMICLCAFLSDSNFATIFRSCIVVSNSETPILCSTHKKEKKREGEPAHIA